MTLSVISVKMRSVPRTAHGRNKAEVHEALAEAAIQLFLERGFDAVTVEDIVASAGVSRRTFFRYFPTKESVVFARRRRQLAAIAALLAVEQPGERPLAAVRRACLALAKEFMADRERIVAVHRLMATTPALVAGDLEVDFELEAVIAAALLARMPTRSARRARWIAAAVVGVLRVMVREWIEADGKPDLAALGRSAFDFLEVLDR